MITMTHQTSAKNHKDKRTHMQSTEAIDVIVAPEEINKVESVTTPSKPQ